MYYFGIFIEHPVTSRDDGKLAATFRVIRKCEEKDKVKSSTFRMLAALLIIALAGFLAGCTADTAFHHIAIEANAPNEQARSNIGPIRDKALVYIVKDQEWLSEWGAGVYTTVGINSRSIAMLSVNSYVKLLLDPGTYALNSFNSIVTNGGGTFKPSGEIGSNSNFVFEAGKVYFISVDYTFVSGSCTFSIMKPEVAAEVIRKPRLKLAKFLSDIPLADERLRLIKAEADYKSKPRTAKAIEASQPTESNLLEDVLGVLLIGFLVFGVAASGYQSSTPPPAPNYAAMNLQQAMGSRPAKPSPAQDSYSFKSAPYSFKEAPYSFDPSKTSINAPKSPADYSTYYSRGGVDWRVNGNKITSSDGQRYSLENDSIYSQTGKRYRIDGSNIIGDDGTRCRVSLNTVTCN